MTPDATADLRAEIDRTRADLGDTVEALAAKFDVKARLSSAADNSRDRLSAAVRATPSWVAAGVGALVGLAAVAAGIWATGRLRT